jgi:hypothetical protein
LSVGVFRVFSVLSLVPGGAANERREAVNGKN